MGIPLLRILSAIIILLVLAPTTGSPYDFTCSGEAAAKCAKAFNAQQRLAREIDDRIREYNSCVALTSDLYKTDCLDQLTVIKNNLHTLKQDREFLQRHCNIPTTEFLCSPYNEIDILPPLSRKERITYYRERKEGRELEKRIIDIVEQHKGNLEYSAMCEHYNIPTSYASRRIYFCRTKLIKDMEHDDKLRKEAAKLSDAVCAGDLSYLELSQMCATERLTKAQYEAADMFIGQRAKRKTCEHFRIR